MFIIILLTVNYVSMEKPPVSYVIFMLNIKLQLISDTFFATENIYSHKPRRAAAF